MIAVILVLIGFDLLADCRKFHRTNLIPMAIGSRPGPSWSRRRILASFSPLSTTMLDLLVRCRRPKQLNGRASGSVLTECDG
jgi:hypothetical protein